jgi:hypothetical protein
MSVSKSEVKHTPGPWAIGRSADNTPLVMVPVHESEGSGFGVAHINRIPRMSSVRGDMDANARLIAAAPDMLAALKLFVEGFDPNNNSDDPAYVLFGDKGKVALAAIAKAEGRQP